MKKIAFVREALKVLGDAPSQQLAEYIHERFEVTIDAAVIPILRASVLELDMLERFRQTARTLVEAALPAKRRECLQSA